MAAKKAIATQVAKVSDTTYLVFKANKPLTQSQFNLAAAMIRQEQEKAGVKTILIPFGVDLEPQKEGDPNADSDNIGERKASTKDK